MPRACRMPMSRSFWLGLGCGMAIAALESLATTFVAISTGFVYPPKGTALMIIGGVNFLLGIVVGILARRFARPGATVASSQREGHAKMAKMLGEEVLEAMLEAIGGFFLGLVVLYPLLTFALQRDTNERLDCSRRTRCDQI
jgi:hypothetical protein